MKGLAVDNHQAVMERLDRLVRDRPRYSRGAIKLPFGELHYVDPFTLRIQYQEIFGDGLYDFDTAKRQPYIIDCGGNIGMSVIRFKMRHPESRILAFEADPDICRVLERNIRSLGLVGVQVVCAAVWTRTGQERFIREGGEGGRLGADGEIWVPTVRLADYLREEVDLLKLDVEGAEWDILEDLCRAGMLKSVRNLIVEFHGWPEAARRLGRILDALDRFGFAMTFPWSFCEPGLAGKPYPTPFPYARDAKFILFMQAWRP